MNNPVSLLEKIKQNQKIKQNNYLLPNTIIYYKNLDDNFILNIFNYYSKINNICIIINNYNKTLFNISKLFKIKLYNPQQLNILIKSKKYNFIANFKDKIVISKLFFIKKQLYSSYINNNFINNNIKPIDLYFQEHIVENKFIIPIEYQNILINLNLYTKNILNSNILYDKESIYYYFEHIYLLNLSRRSDRLHNTLSRLKNCNINTIEHFIAIDGKTPEIELLYKYYLNLPKIKYRIDNKESYIRSSGSFAILLSMKNIIMDAINHNYKNILVLQDDIFIIKNFNNILLKYSKILKGNWKLLFLGANDKNSKQNLKNLKNNLFYYADGLIDGAFAVAIHCSIFKEILDIINTFILPFDSGPLREIQKNYSSECYIFYPNLIIADVSNSDCRENRNQIQLSKKLSWNLNNYTIQYKKNIISNLTIIFYDKFNLFNQSL